MPRRIVIEPSRHVPENTFRLLVSMLVCAPD
jgi:hypothetical protein